ncbi:hypothetical protein C0J45_3456 [Silurus meridionalis]|nr:hypothetical protein C0J45_3456 [Silurus meridionalis]
MLRSKEIQKQMRKKVMEIYQSGKGYKAISKALGLQRSTVREIIHTWQKHGTVENLPRSGRLTKITPRAQRRLIQEITKDPTTTSKELQPHLPQLRNDSVEKQLLELKAETFLSVILEKIDLERGFMGHDLLQSLCRVYVGVCQQRGDSHKSHALAYRLLKEDFLEAPKVIMVMVTAWPSILSHESVLCRSIHVVSQLKAKGKIFYLFSNYLRWDEWGLRNSSCVETLWEAIGAGTRTRSRTTAPTTSKDSSCGDKHPVLALDTAGSRNPWSGAITEEGRMPATRHIVWEHPASCKNTPAMPGGNSRWDEATAKSQTGTPSRVPGHSLRAPRRKRVTNGTYPANTETLRVEGVNPAANCTCKNTRTEPTGQSSGSKSWCSHRDANSRHRAAYDLLMEGALEWRGASTTSGENPSAPEPPLEGPTCGHCRHETQQPLELPHSDQAACPYPPDCSEDDYKPGGRQPCPQLGRVPHHAEKVALRAGKSTHYPASQSEPQYLHAGGNSTSMPNRQRVRDCLDALMKSDDLKRVELRLRGSRRTSEEEHQHHTRAQVQRTYNVARPDIVHSGTGAPWTLDAAAAEDTSQAPVKDVSPPPPPAFEILTENRFTPLCETERHTVILGDSIVRLVRATGAKGKLHTRCFSGARVLDVAAQVPVILNENFGAVVLHVGANDTRLRQTEILKRDFRILVETVRSTSPTTRIIVSGPLPTYQRGAEKFSRLFALNEWLQSWCREHKLLFINNWNCFWERPRFFRPDGLHPSRVGAAVLSDNISRILHTI